MGSIDRTSIGNRMKTYEAVTDLTLMPRAPVVIRVDGKGFSRLTKQMGAAKPFDTGFRLIMDAVMREMCAQIQGCVLGYAQSDEISFIIRNDQSEKAEAYFGNRIQKIASVVAGMASALFTRDLLRKLMATDNADYGVFDARTYAMPDLTEAGNYLVWRQQDCTRNSISSAAYYGLAKRTGRKTAQKMMHGLNSKGLQELMFCEAGINWDKYPEKFKRGTVAFRETTEVETPNGRALRNKWCLQAAPIFTSDEGRAWLYASERLGSHEKQKPDFDDAQA